MAAERREQVQPDGTKPPVAYHDSFDGEVGWNPHEGAGEVVITDPAEWARAHESGGSIVKDKGGGGHRKKH